MDIKTIKRVIDLFANFSEIVNTTEVSSNDVKILSEIQPRISDNLTRIEELVGLINNESKPITIAPTEIKKADPIPEQVSTTSTQTTTTPGGISSYKRWIDIDPDADWKKVSSLNVMASSSGLIYDLYTDQLLPQYFIDGDMRVVLGDDITRDARRTAPIICRAFGIYSGHRDKQMVIDFRNGDRRDLRVQNLLWIEVPVDRPSVFEYLMEDICRRAIEFNGDIEKMLSMYENARPAVTKFMLDDIVSKRTHTDISDKFFMLSSSGEILPRTHIGSDDSPNGLDVSQFILMSGDKKLSEKLLNDKIKDGMALSILEKTVCVFMALDSMGPKIKDVKAIANTVKKKFNGLELPFEFIRTIMDDYTSELARLFGRESKA